MPAGRPGSTECRSGKGRGSPVAPAIRSAGKKTASVLLLFCFGQPLLPIDRHVDRVMRRLGVLPPKATIDEGHDLVLGLFEPDQMYEAHVNLIQHGRRVCHAQRPEHDACPLRARCRFVDPKQRYTVRALRCVS